MVVKIIFGAMEFLGGVVAAVLKRAENALEDALDNVWWA